MRVVQSPPVIRLSCSRAPLGASRIATESTPKIPAPQRYSDRLSMHSPGKMPLSCTPAASSAYRACSAGVSVPGLAFRHAARVSQSDRALRRHSTRQPSQSDSEENSGPYRLRYLPKGSASGASSTMAQNCSQEAMPCAAQRGSEAIRASVSASRDAQLSCASAYSSGSIQGPYFSVHSRHSVQRSAAGCPFGKKRILKSMKK